VSDVATCSTQKLDGTAATCVAPTLFTPTRKKRSDDSETEPAVATEAVVETAVTVDTKGVDCDGKVLCVAPTMTKDKESSDAVAVSATAGAALAVFLNL